MSHFRNTSCTFHFKFSGKENSSPCNFEKAQVPQDDRTDTNFTAPLS